VTTFTRFGTHNAVLPPEGPKTYPFNLDFGAVASILVDMQNEITQGHISFISGGFFDNRANANDLLIQVERVGQVLRIPAGKQSYMPLLVGDAPQVTFKTTAANGLIIPIFVCNFPLWPIVF
jgi:hypothetical protein